MESLGAAVPTSGDAHQMVEECLNNSGDKELSSTASALGDLGTKRRDADYRLNEERAESATNLASALMTAKALIARLDKCTDPDRRRRIAVAIAKHCKMRGWSFTRSN